MRSDGYSQVRLDCKAVLIGHHQSGKGVTCSCVHVINAQRFDISIPTWSELLFLQ